MNFSAITPYVSDDLAASFAVTFFAFFMCALVTIPWLAAHMRFWGIRNGKKSYFVSADLLVRMSMFCLAGVFLSGMMSFQFVSIRHASGLMTAIILMAPLAGAAPLLCTAWGTFCILSKSRGAGNDVGYLVAAGVAAAGTLAIVTALIASAVDESLWPSMRENTLSVFMSPPFLFGLVAALLGCFLVGGVLLMLIGRRSFYWERGVSVSEGAFLIQMGAAPSLLAAVLLVGWAGAWWLAGGLSPLRAILFSGDTLLLSLSGVLVAVVVALIEMLASVLKKKGNAPRLSFTVAVLLLGAVFSATSLFLRPGFSGAPEGGQEAPSAVTQGISRARQ